MVWAIRYQEKRGHKTKSFKSSQSKVALQKHSEPYSLCQNIKQNNCILTIIYNPLKPTSDSQTSPDTREQLLSKEKNVLWFVWDVPVIGALGLDIKYILAGQRGSMGRKKKLENQAEAIIDASMKLFGKYGYAKTTVDDIAKEVGIGKATLYSDFTGKEDILLAVIDRLHGQMLEAMQATIAKTKGPALDMLHKALLKDFMFRFDAIREHHTNLYDMKESISTMGSRFFECKQKAETKKRKLIVELLEKAAQAGEVPASENFEHQAMLIQVAMEGIIPTHYDCSRPEIQLISSDLLNILLSGLKTPR